MRQSFSIRTSKLFNGYILWYAILFGGFGLFVWFSEDNPLALLTLVFALLFFTASKGFQIQNNQYRIYRQIAGIHIGKYRNLEDVSHIHLFSAIERTGMNYKSVSSSYNELVYKAFLIHKDGLKTPLISTDNSKKVSKILTIISAKSDLRIENKSKLDIPFTPPAQTT